MTDVEVLLSPRYLSNGGFAGLGLMRIANLAIVTIVFDSISIFLPSFLPSIIGAGVLIWVSV